MARFHLGLTMAGAISAGAYSAGVFDFLMEALDAWEERKQALREARVPVGEWDVPSHEVVIPVMTGASAGGITGALGLVTLAEQPAGTLPVRYHYDDVGTVQSRLPRLYRAWVQMPSFLDATDGLGLLGTSDLGAGAVTSLLDSSLLARIVDASMLGIAAVRPPRPYLAGPMHLFLTEANLRGVRYEVAYIGGSEAAPGYPMMCHADRVHYAVHGVGTALFESRWADPDPQRPIDVADLPALRTVEGAWLGYAQAALGTGAFPVGLRARAIEGVTVADYLDRQWPIAHRADAAGTHAFRLAPDFRELVPGRPGDRVDYVAVDGGLINNEPFELARWTLMADPPQPNPPDEADADRAVVMIDPFPEAEIYAGGLSLDVSLRGIAGRLVTTLKQQVRFKPEELAAALDETIYSRFLIAPRRRAGRDAPLEPFAIACGLLGGFGGFLSETFRAHDYQLGRLNCFLFLKGSLALPLENRVLAAGYGAKAQREEFRTASGVAGDARPFYQLIPLVGSAAVQPDAPRWPRIKRGEVEGMVAAATRRAAALVDLTAGKELRSRLLRLAVRAAWPAFGRGALERRVRWSLIQDLILRDQLEGPSAGLPLAERKVLAGLADPAWDFRTAAGIAGQYGLAAAEVAEMLAAHQGFAVEGPRLGGAVTWTLAERKPSGFWSRGPARAVRDWLLGSPAVD